MYYSASAKGFYSTAKHGQRRILIADPQAIRPTIDVTLEPGEFFKIGNGDELTNAGPLPQVFTGIPDMAWMPPSIEVDNPDCLIPADSVEITDAHYAALLAGQSADQCIVADDDGRPVLAPRPAPTMEELSSRARADRDRRMADFEWRYERHSRELRLGISPTDDIGALDAHMQALAEVSNQAGFPGAILWPVFPLPASD